jgi:hypothetical protein
MSNVLADDKHHQILALGRLGWSLRRIERTTGVWRETISGYDNVTAVRLLDPHADPMGATTEVRFAPERAPSFAVVRPRR